jgi:hypothetical protein
MKRIFQQSFRLAAERLVFILLGLVLVGSVQATGSLYVNNSAAYYTVGNAAPQPPPTLDYTAFANENVFSVSYLNYNLGYPFFETVNTLYYTNNGTMICNSPVQTNGFVASFSDGFVFDYLNGGFHKMSGTFYNPGVIRCNSTNDGNGIFFIGGLSAFFVNSVGKCEVLATNIISPGTINAGPSGTIKLNSLNADLSFGSIYLEAPLTAGFLLSGFGFFTTSQSLPNLTALGSAGTNFPWSPRANLGTTTVLQPGPISRLLTNVVQFSEIQNLTPTNILVRVVYVLNNSPGVPYKVYITNSPAANGGATVEFDGVFTDAATCDSATNYLYLNNDYVLGSSTNVFVFNGQPNNFNFTASTTPLIAGPSANSGLGINYFPTNATLNNNYSYVDASFLSSTVSTNASGINPSGSITNLAGKIYITASNELTLANAQIGGENYLSLIAPNQFNGSQNAQITAPYADINVGVTNGHLQVANLIAAGVGALGGSVQAWSTRWIYTDPAGAFDVDYRVLIVSANLTAKSDSWIQTLRMHATNSLVVSDVMNVYKTLNVDAQRLTISTNGCGYGFTSVAGALNWANSATFGPGQIPNVLWLTNNGTLTAWNDAIFGTSSLRYAAFINRGLVANSGTVIWTTNFVNAGVITNGSGPFTLQTQRAVMTNGAVYANGPIAITTPTLYITNEILSAGRSLTILATNLLADGGNSSNFWSVGSLANTGDGLVLPIKPVTGDLLGTTITNFAPPTKSIINVWAGEDRGYSLTGFSNNAAVGHLVLNAQSSGSSFGRFTFNGVGASNAMYVDCIEFKDYSTNRDASLNMSGITFNTNLVIYYAQAILNGSSIAEKLNLKNTNNLVNNLTSHFRWVPAYAGLFSSTNFVYPDGSTNVVNAALAQSGSIDSDGDGTPNNADPTPFFVASQIQPLVTITNLPPRRAALAWTTVPLATNIVWFKTNLLSPTWSVLTNFPSPQAYVAAPGADNYQQQRVRVLDVLTNTARFYRIEVQPALTYPNPY